MARLFSKHHDRFHIHKSLGLFVLLHFVYRMGRLVTTGKAFNGRPIVALSMHVLLHVSSYFFTLPQRRNSKAPMIWPAYRTHNAIFAIRNLVGPVTEFRVLFVWLFMGLADLGTHIHSQGDATTRAMPYNFSERSVRVLKSFYMQCQFHATLLSVTDPELSFFCVFPIELASFAMTLARKGIISTLQWHLIYALALWSVYAFMIINPTTSLTLAGILGGIAKEVRQHLRVNKYVLWALTVLTHGYLAARLPPLTSSYANYVRFAMFLAALRQCLRLGRVFVKESSNTIVEAVPVTDE